MRFGSFSCLRRQREPLKELALTLLLIFMLIASFLAAGTVMLVGLVS